MKSKLQTLAAGGIVLAVLAVAFLSPAYATVPYTTSTDRTGTVCHDGLRPVKCDPTTVTVTVTVTSATGQDGSGVTWYLHYAFFDVTLRNGTTGPATWCWTYPQVYASNDVTSSTPDTAHGCHGVATTP